MEQQAVELALGRMFRLASRPFQEGDIEQYEMCRRVILECAPSPTPSISGFTVNYVRDRSCGAQGVA